MLKKLLKISGFTIVVILGIMLIGFMMYVIKYYPRKIDSFEIFVEQPKQKIIIASQGSEFKNVFVQLLCDSLHNSSNDIRVMDVGDLNKLNIDSWDKVLIINTFMIKLNKKVQRFVDRVETKEKLLLLVTSGGADWQPIPGLKVDAFTTASRKEYHSDLLALIMDWINNKDQQNWEPHDYLLALKYFPKIDVNKACKQIENLKTDYLMMYPNLVNELNYIGYQYLRVKRIETALEVFFLNTRLFPENWNVYDSYGEALANKGEINEAVANYQKALHLNPESKSAKQMLDKLLN